MEEAETFSNLIKHKNEKKRKEMAYQEIWKKRKRFRTS